MGLEQEQGYLYVDRWYYDYTISEFLDLIKRYPYVPFFVDSGEETFRNKYFRWNKGLDILEYIYVNKRFSSWNQGNINIKDSSLYKNTINFVLFRETLISHIYKKRDDINIILCRADQELISRKNLKI